MTMNSQFCNYDYQCRNFTDELRREVAQAFVSSDEPAEAFATRYGVHSSTVRGWAERFYPEEHAARRTRVGGNVRRKQTPELVDKAVALVRQGYSVNHTARQVKVAPQTICEWLRQHGYGELIKPPRRRLIPLEVKRKAVSDYLSGTPSYKVAPKYGVSPTAVERWANQSLAGEL